jgi:hypothetical protein
MATIKCGPRSSDLDHWQTRSGTGGGQTPSLLIRRAQRILKTARSAKCRLYRMLPNAYNFLMLDDRGHLLAPSSGGKGYPITRKGSPWEESWCGDLVEKNTKNTKAGKGGGVISSSPVPESPSRQRRGLWGLGRRGWGNTVALRLPGFPFGLTKPTPK